jgi:hypothetical protein
VNNIDIVNADRFRFDRDVGDEGKKDTVVNNDRNDGGKPSRDRTDPGKKGTVLNNGSNSINSTISNGANTIVMDRGDHLRESVDRGQKDTVANNDNTSSTSRKDLSPRSSPIREKTTNRDIKYNSNIRIPSRRHPSPSVSPRRIKTSDNLKNNDNINTSSSSSTPPRHIKTRNNINTKSHHNEKIHSDHLTIPLSVSVSPQRLMSVDKAKSTSKIRRSQEIRKSIESMEISNIADRSILGISDKKKKKMKDKIITSGENILDSMIAPIRSEDPPLPPPTSSKTDDLPLRPPPFPMKVFLLPLLMSYYLVYIIRVCRFCDTSRCNLYK